MLRKTLIVFLSIFTLFVTPVCAEESIEKKVEMVTVYDVYSLPRVPMLRLIITANTLQKPVGEYGFLYRKDELANIKAKDVVFHENLFYQIPQDFLNRSNDSFSSPNDAGGCSIYIIFDDGSINTWGIFFPEKSYSEDVQLFLKKINSIMGSEGTTCPV